MEETAHHGEVMDIKGGDRKPFCKESNIKHQNFCPSLFPLSVMITLLLWILKQGWLESSGLRLIFLSSQTKSIASRVIFEHWGNLVAYTTTNQRVISCKLWQNSKCNKTQLVTKLKLWQNSSCDKTHIVIKLKW